MRRSAFDPVNDRHFTTLGAKVSKKEIVFPIRLRDGTYVDLILWTVNPLALTRRETAVARGAAGILAVCDSTRKKTLPDLSGLIKPVHDASGNVPIVLAVNKWDLEADRQIDPSDAVRFVSSYTAEHFFTSAITGENVEATFQALGERIVIHRRAKVSDGEAHGPP